MIADGIPANAAWRRALIEEFQRQPIGRHSPDLRLLLNHLRAGQKGDPYTLWSGKWRERCARVKTKSTIGARNLPVLTVLGHSSPHGQGSTLPIPFGGGNLSSATLISDGWRRRDLAIYRPGFVAPYAFVRMLRERLVFRTSLPDGSILDAATSLVKVCWA